MEKIIDRINLTCGAAVALFSYLLGEHWWLFAAFLALNVTDYITGFVKARMTKTENSNKGMRGIVKKVGYWVVIGIAFFISVSFEEIGGIIGVNLGVVRLFGWFTLATFIINEIRSVLENLVALGVKIPDFLIRGLSAAQKAVEGEEDDQN